MLNLTRLVPVISDIRSVDSGQQTSRSSDRFCNGMQPHSFPRKFPEKLHCREKTVIAALAILRTKRKLTALGFSTLMQFSLLRTPLGFVAEYRSRFYCLSCRTGVEQPPGTSKTIGDCFGYLIVSRPFEIGIAFELAFWPGKSKKLPTMSRKEHILAHITVCYVLVFIVCVCVFVCVCVCVCVCLCVCVETVLQIGSIIPRAVVS